LRNDALVPMTVSGACEGNAYSIRACLFAYVQQCPSLSQHQIIC